MTTKKKQSREKYVFRIPCTLSGHEEDWIEYDTSEWTLVHYRQIYELSYPNSLKFYVERYTTNWHLTGDGGEIVEHPAQIAETGGRQPTDEDWQVAYRRLGDEGIRLLDWLALSPVLAVGKRLEASKKSDAGREGSGEE